MSAPLQSYANSATRVYIGVVRDYVIYPLETSKIAESCYAAALLVFGAVDGLGKLTHPDDRAGAGERFKSFLHRMGTPYAAIGDELWNLRNSLAHNAMNVACFMSKTDEAYGEHLELEAGFVFVHTGRLLEDFKRAVDKLEEELLTSATSLERSESRLLWDSINQSGWRGDKVRSTPPPGIRFVREK